MELRIGLAALLLAGAVLWATGAEAQSTATTGVGGSTSIGAPASIAVTRNLSFTILPQALNTGLSITSSLNNGVNANVVLTGGQTASVSVPATFEVIRNDGGESIIVRTVGTVSHISGVNGSVQVLGLFNGLFNDPVTVVGAIDDGQLSFNVGAEVTVTADLVPGLYQGVLTVIAQYN